MVKRGVVAVTGGGVECVHAGTAAWARVLPKSDLRTLKRCVILHSTHISVHGTDPYMLGGPGSEVGSGQSCGKTTPPSLDRP